MSIGARGLVALALVVTACGSPSSRTSAGLTVGGNVTAGTEITQSPRARGSEPETAASVPPLSVTTIDGRAVTVPDGSTPTIVYFMATWCLSCLRGAAELAALYRDHAERDLRVLAIDLDPADEPGGLAAIRDRYLPRAGFLWAIDDGQRAARAYGIRALDATILLGPHGEVLFRSKTYPDFAALRRAVQAAVGR